MRRLIAIPLCLAFLLSFMQSPMIHVHGDGEEQHEGSLLHGHLAEAASHEASVEAAGQGDDVRLLDWFELAKAHTVTLEIELADISVLVRPINVTVLAEVLTPRAHDPPSLSSSSPRAPPV